MERVSKTQLKQQALALQALGERLVNLSSGQLAGIPLPEDVVAAVALAKTITKHGGRLRQMQYIGTLMRKHDPAPVQAALQRIDESLHERSAEHAKIEAWRDGLLAGNDLLIEEILTQVAGADRAALVLLVQKAREERSGQRPAPKASRALFRYLAKCTEQRA